MIRALVFRRTPRPFQNLRCRVYMDSVIDLSSSVFAMRGLWEQETVAVFQCRVGGFLAIRFPE